VVVGTVMVRFVNVIFVNRVPLMVLQTGQLRLESFIIQGIYKTASHSTRASNCQVVKVSIQLD